MPLANERVRLHVLRNTAQNLQRNAAVPTSHASCQTDRNLVTNAIGGALDRSNAGSCILVERTWPALWWLPSSGSGGSKVGVLMRERVTVIVLLNRNSLCRVDDLCIFRAQLQRQTCQPQPVLGLLLRRFATLPPHTVRGLGFRADDKHVQCWLLESDQAADLCNQPCTLSPSIRLHLLLCSRC